MEGDGPMKDLASLEAERKDRMLGELMRAACKTKVEKESVHKTVDNWRTDLHIASSLRWYGTLPDNPEEAFTLRYKAPEWPHQKALWHTLTQIPKLTYLILDRSELSSLRELGSSLQSLVTLSICNCGLTNLDGTFAFPNLRTLIASDNKLTSPAQCSYLEQLQHLDLCANPISTHDGFVHLSLCTHLRSLHLNGTPISKQLDFQTKLKSLIPQLKELYPGGYRENPDDDTADLDAFILRNRHIIGSSYDVMKAKSKAGQKQKRKNKEKEMQETSYQDLPPEGSTDTTIQVHLSPNQFPSNVAERSLSATSSSSSATATSNDPLTPIYDLNSNRTADEKD